MPQKIFFITGNKNKYIEAQKILPQLEQLDIDLPEIQSLDAEKIIRFKLEAARQQTKETCVVEDSSLEMDCLHGLPGPLVKWFLETIGSSGLADLAKKCKNDRAVARVTLGYVSGDGQVDFFSAHVSGRITTPQSATGFGWDVIFQPDGFDRAFSLMTKEEKNRISHRGQAFQALKKFLEQP